MKKTAITALLVILTTMALPLAVSAADDAAALYKAKCASCHGADGAGKTALAKTKKLPDLRSAEFQKLTDEQLTTAITTGTTTMKAAHAFKTKGLTDAQIKSLVVYMRTFAPKTK